VVERAAPALRDVLARLAAAAPAAVIAMVDGALVMPTAPPPTAWNEVRLRLPAGMVTLRRHVRGVAVVVFGNADATMVAAQEAVAEALRAG
jgi:hypothetical protein